MGKVRIRLYAVCIIWASAVFLVTHRCMGLDELTWSKQAAAEAEAVASISCSGHGKAYVDGLIEDGKHVCECNTCYGGPDCSQLLSDCAVDAGSGDPLFLEPFWVKHAASSAVVVSGWHRMSYYFPDGSYISEQLENHIRKLHSIAKNAVTEGKYIIYGVGSTQLLSAAVFALSTNLSSQARVVAVPPFYPVYKSQTDYFETARFRFDETLSPGNNSVGGAKVIEMIASPNNPDGILRKNSHQGPSVRTIYDHAYYWPHFTAIPAPADEDVMIFTLSKLTGHAGSRFGWAILKDRTTYENMIDYLEEAALGTSRDTQLRIFQILRTVVQGDGKELFNFAYKNMRDRWRKISSIISKSRRFTLQEIPPQFCTFFEQVRGPSPAYAWVKCERKEDSNCAEVFTAANITGRAGRVYFADDRYVRLTLLRSQDDFNLLVDRLTTLVSKEK